MTFKEYLSFEEQSKVPLFSVEITVKDCEYIVTSHEVFKGNNVKMLKLAININGIVCQYNANARYGKCYTAGDHDRMKNPTVFTFVDKI